MSSGHNSVTEWRGDNLLVRVRAQPRASRDEILGVENNQLRIKTTATPTDGKANKKIAKLLADFVSVPPSRVSLVRGHTHRDKQFLVTGPVNLPPEFDED